jgi:hypothetical protein
LENTKVILYGSWKEGKRQIADAFNWQKILSGSDLVIQNKSNPFVFKGNFMFTFPLQGLVEEDKKTVRWYFWQLMGKKKVSSYVYHNR